MTYSINKKQPFLASVFTAPLLLSLVTLLCSTPAIAESLSDALRAVHGGNAKLEAERAKQRGESEKVPQARAGFMPNVYLQADNGMLYDKNLRSGSTSRTNPHSVGLGFSQPIFNGFRTMGDYQRAQDEVLASQSNLLSAQQTTLLYGAQAYMRVLRDRQVLSLRRQNLSNLREQQVQANARFKAGDMTLTGVDQTKARVAEAEADLAQTQADLADSESYYRYMIGRAPGALKMPALSRVTLPCSVQDAVIVAESDNPNLQSAYHLERAADGSIKSAKAAFYPNLSLEGSVRRGFDDSKISGAQVDDATLGVKMSIPLYSGGIDKSRVRAAEAAKNQRTFELNDARNNTRRMVTSSYDALRSAKLRKIASIKRVSATNAALYGLTVEFKAGQIPLVNVLDGRREASNARVNQAVSEFDEGMNIFNLLASIGHLDMAMVDALTQGRSVNTSAMCHKNAAVGSIKRSLPAAELAKLSPSQPAVKELAAKSKDMIEPEVLSQAGDEKPLVMKLETMKPDMKAVKVSTEKTLKVKSLENKVEQPEILALVDVDNKPVASITKKPAIIAAPVKIVEAKPLPKFDSPRVDSPRVDMPLVSADTSLTYKPGNRPGALAAFRSMLNNSEAVNNDAPLNLAAQNHNEPVEVLDAYQEPAEKPMKAKTKASHVKNLTNIKANAPIILGE